MANKHKVAEETGGTVRGGEWQGLRKHSRAEKVLYDAKTTAGVSIDIHIGRLTEIFNLAKREGKRPCMVVTFEQLADTDIPHTWIVAPFG